MIKFAVIIPFRSKNESINWTNECFLLKQTILSVLQQQYQNFRIFVVYTDKPDDLVLDQKLNYVHFYHGFQSYDEIVNSGELLDYFKSKRLVVRRWDKARKIMYGIQLAKEIGCEYSMNLDADDRISFKLLKYMADESLQKKCNGWYIDKGYIYKSLHKYLIHVPSKMYYLNGSCHVIHNKFIDIPDFNSSNWQDYNLFVDHGWIRNRLKNVFNIELNIIPFPAVVYFVHESNISNISSIEYGNSLKNIFKRILRFNRLTYSLRSEFLIKE